MTDTSMERLMSLAALTASVATPAPSPVRGEPDPIETFSRWSRQQSTDDMETPIDEYGQRILSMVIRELRPSLASLLSDRERMTRRIAELEADEVRLDELSRWSVVDWQWGRLTVRCVTADARLAYGPREITGATLRDAAAKLVIARASLPSDPDHER